MLFFRLLSRLPFPLVYAVAWLAYLFIYYLSGYRKAVVRQNLRQAFPDKSETEITKLAKSFYRHLTNLGLEIVKARTMTAQQFEQRVQITNPELLLDKTEGRSRSVIILTIHQGNWEWMLHGVALHLNVPMYPVYKPLHSGGWDEWAKDVRSRFGSQPLPMSDATRDIIRRRSEFRMFVMVADQAPIESERSHWVPYLNKEAPFYLGAEKIAQMTRFPVVFAQCTRHATGHYELTFREVADPPYEKEGHAILESYVQLAESAIRAQPETFLWSNRRWKRDRAVEEAAQAEADSSSQSNPAS